MNHKTLLWLSALLLVFSLLGSFLGFFDTQGIQPLFAAQFPEISLSGRERLLVLAPHTDDETLGAAGMVISALRQGLDVRVVIATNGDGYLFATMEDFRKVYPRPADYIRMGDLRQQESIRAMGVLGVPADHVTFLSYPDRGTPSLWNTNWYESQPYRSPYTGQTHSPYLLTYDPSSVYAGEDLLRDLRSILESYRPDVIVFPHPDDVHPDHWGLSAFTRLALALIQHDQPDYLPDTYTYLVHRPDFPTPKGLHPNLGLLPPPKLYGIDRDWVRFSLSEADAALKQKAVGQYRSQLPLLSWLLDSFVRANEIFSRPVPADLPVMSAGDPADPATWRTASGDPISPVQLDPAHDSISRDVVSSADLVALYVTQAPGGRLASCAELRGPPRSELIYSLRITAFGPQGVIHYVARNHRLQHGWRLLHLSGDYACTQVSLSDLGNPWFIFAGADSEDIGIGIIDQVAWQQIQIEPEGAQ